MKLKKCHAQSVIKIFSHKENMKAHFRRKHEGKTFDCEQCDKQFSSAAAINNHVRAIRDKEKNWPCHTCNTKYPF